VTCTRYITNDPHVGKSSWPCGNSATEPCLGLVPWPSFTNLTSSDVLCLLRSPSIQNKPDYFITPTSVPHALEIPLGASICSPGLIGPVTVASDPALNWQFSLLEIIDRNQTTGPIQNKLTHIFSISFSDFNFVGDGRHLVKFRGSPQDNPLPRIQIERIVVQRVNTTADYLVGAIWASYARMTVISSKFFDNLASKNVRTFSPLPYASLSSSDQPFP